ncbi:MAG: rare lipoprotein A [Candidatus Azotimanducaceae bacterium]
MKQRSVSYDCLEAFQATKLLTLIAFLTLAGCQSPSRSIATTSTTTSTNTAENSSANSGVDTDSEPVSPVAPFKRQSFTAGNRTPYEVWGETYHILPSSLGYVEIGIASWYGKKFHGRKTSNGEVYDMYQLSAAHKSLPLPTWVRVTNLDNGKKVVLRVNDRGPFHDDRLIDLSWKTALALGFADKGTAPVVVEAIDHDNYPELATASLLGDQFYLQIGAFSNLSGAKLLRQQIDLILASSALGTSTRILQSELEASILHKVWLGPIANENMRDQIAMLVESADLGKPLNVDVAGESADSASAEN